MSTEHPKARIGFVLPVTLCSADPAKLRLNFEELLSLRRGARE